MSKPKAREHVLNEHYFGMAQKCCLLTYSVLRTMPLHILFALMTSDVLKSRRICTFPSYTPPAEAYTGIRCHAVVLKI